MKKSMTYRRLRCSIPFCSRPHYSGIVPITANSIHIFWFILSHPLLTRH